MPGTYRAWPVQSSEEYPNTEVGLQRAGRSGGAAEERAIPGFEEDRGIRADRGLHTKSAVGIRASRAAARQRHRHVTTEVQALCLLRRQVVQPASEEAERHRRSAEAAELSLAPAAELAECIEAETHEKLVGREAAPVEPAEQAGLRSGRTEPGFLD